jgi:hypothetical protein
LHEQIISSYLQEIERLKNQDPLQDNITWLIKIIKAE